MSAMQDFDSEEMGWRNWLDVLMIQGKFSSFGVGRRRATMWDDNDISCGDLPDSYM